MLEIIAFVLFSHQPMTPMLEGTASYYTVQSAGAMTASGERLQNGEMTCAMLQGEFGEYFLVVAENGRSVVCRLNDRGPFTKNRVIDLSQAAMRELHPTAGLLQVKIYRLGANPPAELTKLRH
ncbi:MAG: hypothetical protein GX117_13215 [Candidatus Hydrogenedentes bacterium]|jgi:rare lipoprotein A|nr:hypothetical protein [Candidatus Hydrogenedentota bacterium]